MTVAMWAALFGIVGGVSGVLTGVMVIVGAEDGGPKMVALAVSAYLITLGCAMGLGALFW